MSSNQEESQLRAFGKRLAEIRKQRNLTQQELAARLDTSLVSIAYIETGKRWPRLVTIHRIAKQLNVPIEELFKGL